MRNPSENQNAKTISLASDVSLNTKIIIKPSTVDVLEIDDILITIEEQIKPKKMKIQKPKKKVVIEETEEHILEGIISGKATQREKIPSYMQSKRRRINKSESVVINPDSVGGGCVRKDYTGVQHKPVRDIFKPNGSAVQITVNPRQFAIPVLPWYEGSGKIDKKKGNKSQYPEISSLVEQLRYRLGNIPKISSSSKSSQAGGLDKKAITNIVYNLTGNQPTQKPIAVDTILSFIDVYTQHK